MSADVGATLSRLRVVVLMGGPSREHAVSLLSGSAVASALSDLGCRALPVRIERDGRWTLPGPAESALPPGGVSEPGPGAAPPAAALARLAEGAGQGLDVVFVALHGPFGEDGTVQGFLETAGVAFTGSGVAASALAMDKERTKEVLVHHGLRTPPWISVDRAGSGDRAALLRRVEAELGWPVVVKPPRDGSSFGVTVAEDGAQLAAAVGAALEGPDGRALLERRVAGIEVTCPVIGNRGARLEALPLVEIVPRGRAFFDFAAKYQGASEEICPARLQAEVARRVQEQAVTAHRVLGCDGLSRSDFIVDPLGEPWFLETNTVPGMTEQSLCPLSARAAGMSFADLCARLVVLALERQRGSMDQ